MDEQLEREHERQAEYEHRRQLEYRIDLVVCAVAVLLLLVGVLRAS